MLSLNIIFNHSCSRKLLASLWVYLCCACYGYAQCPDSPGDPYYVRLLSHGVSITQTSCNPNCPVVQYPSSGTQTLDSLIIDSANRLRIVILQRGVRGAKPCFDIPSEVDTNYYTYGSGTRDYRSENYYLEFDSADYGAPIYRAWDYMGSNVFRSESLEAIRRRIEAMNDEQKRNFDMGVSDDIASGNCAVDGSIVYFTIGAVWRHSELLANPTNFPPTLPDCLCQPTSAGKCFRKIPCADGTNNNCVEIYDCQASLCRQGYEPGEEQPCATTFTITIQQPPKPE